MHPARTVPDGRAEFDFLIGTWRSRHRRLRERLKGSDDWEEFEGLSEGRMVLGGLGNFDEITIERESGRAHGLTLRLYNPVARQWSLYWSSSLTGTLDVPMVGEFVAGRGEFYAQEQHEGRQVLSRFIWSAITPTSCRWEQALSPDGGKSWETNWIMEFTRIG
ncbi:MAG: hypothetical protein U0841_21120 [Chloroflexia bacterium]